jgi:hypothetical protein
MQRDAYDKAMMIGIDFCVMRAGYYSAQARGVQSVTDHA